MPVLTLPKATLVGVIVATGAVATPVPLTAILRAAALLVTETAPLIVPAAVGLNETLPAID